MIETDPIDPIAPATGIEVAKLDAPLRRPIGLNVAQRLLHGRMLHFHAARLPVTIHPDVERNRIVDDRSRPGGR